MSTVQFIQLGIGKAAFLSCLPAFRVLLFTTILCFLKKVKPKIGHPLVPVHREVLPSQGQTMKWVWATLRSGLNFYCFVCFGKFRIHIYDLKNNYFR